MKLCQCGVLCWVRAFFTSEAFKVLEYVSMFIWLQFYMISIIVWKGLQILNVLFFSGRANEASLEIRLLNAIWPRHLTCPLTFLWSSNQSIILLLTAKTVRKKAIKEQIDLISLVAIFFHIVMGLNLILIAFSSFLSIFRNLLSPEV